MTIELPDGYHCDPPASLPLALGSSERLGPLPAAKVPEGSELSDDFSAYDDWYTAEQMEAERLRCYGLGVAAERERCASICDGIGATYTGEARRLQGQHATHAAGRRDGANECAAKIRRA